MTDDDDQRVGEVFLDRLKVLRRIGGGGMGAVYEVEHLRTGHHRALKIVRPEYSAQPRYMQRLLREAKVAATLKTVHVAETLDAGILEDGSAYVLMELLEGRPLIALLEERSRLEPEEVVWIASEICQGLEVAHAEGIVHRDLKPENIFLVPSGEDGALVKILDFGISQFPASMAEAPTRLTRQGTILGTPFYMSPEQASGRKMDARTDIYALGIVMYEALSGTLPFDSPTIGELFLRIATGEYTPLEQRVETLDPNLVAVVARAMSRDLNDRFDSAKQLKGALAPFMGHGPAAPGRVTLKLNALVRATAPRAETLDYASSPRERETAADSSPMLPGDAATPAAGVADVASRATPADDARPPAKAVSEGSLVAMGAANAPPADLPLRAPSSVPPPPSIPAWLAPTLPARAKRADWRLPLALAGLVAAAAIAWTLFGNAGRATPVVSPTVEVQSGPTAPPDAGVVPALPAVVVAPTVDAATPVVGSFDAGATTDETGSRSHPSVTHPPSTHVGGRPSQAAGLDQNPY